MGWAVRWIIRIWYYLCGPVWKGSGWVIHKLIDLHYDRNDMDFSSLGTFRVHGDMLEIFRQNRMNMRIVWSFRR